VHPVKPSRPHVNGTDKPGTRHPQQVTACRLSPLSNPRAAPLRSIDKTNRNPERHKKILAQKGLDKVYISYQSAMTTT